MLHKLCTFIFIAVMIRCHVVKWFKENCIARKNDSNNATQEQHKENCECNHELYTHRNILHHNLLAKVYLFMNLFDD